MNFLESSLRKEVKYKVFFKDIHKLYSWLIILFTKFTFFD